MLRLFRFTCGAIFLNREAGQILIATWFIIWIKIYDQGKISNVRADYFNYSRILKIK